MPTMPCDKCSGTGQLPLAPELEETFAAVKSGLHTAHQIYGKDRNRQFIGITAINRRLERLRNMGLLCRERQGRSMHYNIQQKKEPNEHHSKR